MYTQGIFKRKRHKLQMLWGLIIPTSESSKVEMGGMDYQEGTVKMATWVREERKERGERKEIPETQGQWDPRERKEITERQVLKELLV
jgi:hypothetical protein